MAHSTLKSRFTDSLFCVHPLTYARTHLFVDLNNTYKTIFNSVVIPVARTIVRVNLYVASLPLYTIRQLPFCLPGVKPVDFYYQQWQEDVQHLLRTRHQLKYSLYRLPDATQLAWRYGIKTLIGLKKSNECGDHCDCKANEPTKNDTP